MFGMDMNDPFSNGPLFFVLTMGLESLFLVLYAAYLAVYNYLFSMDVEDVEGDDYDA